jgi:hypothetical protein
VRRSQHPAVLLAVITSPFAIGAWWTVRTWKRLWRCGRTPRERLTYDRGVRGYGLGKAVAIFCIVTWLGWTTDVTLFGPMMMAEALASIFFGVPISLNMGYFWGSIFATIVGIDSDPQCEVARSFHAALGISHAATSRYMARVDGRSPSAAPESREGALAGFDRVRRNPLSGRYRGRVAPQSTIPRGPSGASSFRARPCLS